MLKYFLIGLLGAPLILFVSKVVMARILQREEDYYEKEEGGAVDE